MPVCWLWNCIFCLHVPPRWTPALWSKRGYTLHQRPMNLARAKLWSYYDIEGEIFTWSYCARSGSSRWAGMTADEGEFSKAGVAKSLNRRQPCFACSSFAALSLSFLQIHLICFIFVLLFWCWCCVLNMIGFIGRMIHLFIFTYFATADSGWWFKQRCIFMHKSHKAADEFCTNVRKWWLVRNVKVTILVSLFAAAARLKRAFEHRKCNESKSRAAIKLYVILFTN